MGQKCETRSGSKMLLREENGENKKRSEEWRKNRRNKKSKARLRVSASGGTSHPEL